MDTVILEPNSVQITSINLMCSMSVHYIIQKNFKHQRMHKEFFSSIITHSYIFRPCWVIFREKLSVVVTLGCLYKPRLQRVHASISGALHSQQHILA
jgi:hypothetical protein